MKGRHQPGFTLLEVSLSSAIGIILVLTAFGTWSVHKAQIRQNKARLVLEAVRSAIQFYKGRCGTYPLIGQVITNDMSGGACDVTAQAFYGDTPGAAFPNDPFLQVNTVIPPPINNAGGWIYEDIRGTFKINLNDTNYGLSGTTMKLESDPSTW